MKERKALIVHYTPMADAAEATADLNAHLGDGWRLVTLSPMGGGPGGTGAEAHFASVAVLERDEERTVTGFGRS